MGEELLIPQQDHRVNICAKNGAKDGRNHGWMVKPWEKWESPLFIMYIHLIPFNSIHLNPW
jgi:hypothetical protein